LRQRAQVAFVDWQIGHPHKARGLWLTVCGFGFVKFNDIEQVFPASRIAVLNSLNPTEVPFELDRFANLLFEPSLRLKFGEADEFVVDARQALLLQNDDEVPVIVAAALK